MGSQAGAGGNDDAQAKDADGVDPGQLRHQSLPGVADVRAGDAGGEHVDQVNEKNQQIDGRDFFAIVDGAPNGKQAAEALQSICVTGQPRLHCQIIFDKPLQPACLLILIYDQS